MNLYIARRQLLAQGSVCQRHERKGDLGHIRLGAVRGGVEDHAGLAVAGSLGLQQRGDRHQDSDTVPRGFRL